MQAKIENLTILVLLHIFLLRYFIKYFLITRISFIKIFNFFFLHSWKSTFIPRYENFFLRYILGIFSFIIYKCKQVERVKSIKSVNKIEGHPSKSESFSKMLLIFEIFGLKYSLIWFPFSFLIFIERHNFVKFNRLEI